MKNPKDVSKRKIKTAITHCFCKFFGIIPYILILDMPLSCYGGRIMMIVLDHLILVCIQRIVNLNISRTYFLKCASMDT